MSVPDPATTNWVPLQGRPSGAAYFGQYQSSGHTYYDGDCVIGSDGVLYMCVTDGTTTPPISWPGAAAPQGVAGPQGPQGVGIPMPVVNGSWIKGVGGAAVWTPLVATEIPGLVVADTQWKVLGTDVSYASANFSNYGAPFGPVRFRKLASGLVITDGLMNCNVGTGVAFTYPTGYRVQASALGSHQLIFHTASSINSPTEMWRTDDGGALSYTGNAVGWVSTSGLLWYAG